jgi:hypothetical protein
MSDMVPQDRPEKRKTSRFLSILSIIALLLPHTLEFQRVGALDSTYVRFTVFGSFWMTSLETGSSIAGPYTSTSIEFLTVQIVIFSFLFLPFGLLLIVAQMRFMKGITSKKTIKRIIGLVLIVQTFILFGFFSWQLDGWAFAQTYPLPILHALIVRSVIRQGDSESD